MNMDFYSEKIDAYLNGELSERERAIFEEIMEQDPLIKGEVQFQKEILDSIRDRRKIELKARLDNVEIDSGTIFYLPKTTFINTLLVASMFTGVLVVFDYAQKAKWFETAKNNELMAKESTLNSKKESNTLLPSNTEHTPIEEKTLNERKALNQSSDIRQAQIVKPIVVKTYQNYQRNNQNSVNLLLVSQANKIRKNKLPLATETLESSIDCVDKDEKSSSKVHHIIQDEKNLLEPAFPSKDVSDKDVGIYDGKNEPRLEDQKLYYLYYNNRLFRISDMSGSKEIHLPAQNNTTRHFLFYKNNFYEFFDKVYVKTPMKLITDPTLIEELKKAKIEAYGK